MRLLHAADRVAQRGRARRIVAREQVGAARVVHAHVHVQAAAGAAGERLGHEAGDQAMFLSGAAHRALEHHRLVHGAQRVVAMMQRDLELARRVLGHQRLGRQPLRDGRAVHLVEHRREVIEPLQAVGIDLLPLAAPPAARRHQPAIRLFLE